MGIFTDMWDALPIHYVADAVVHPIKTSKTVWNDITHPLKTAKHFTYDHPKQVAEDTIHAVKHPTSVVTDAEKDVKDVVQDIRNDFLTIYDDAKIGAHWVEHEVDVAGRFASEAWKDDLKPVLVDSVKLLEFTGKTLDYAIEHYEIVLGVLGSYFAFKYINSATQAMKAIL